MGVCIYNLFPFCRLQLQGSSDQGIRRLMRVFRLVNSLQRERRAAQALGARDRDRVLLSCAPIRRPVQIFCLMNWR